MDDFKELPLLHFSWDTDNTENLSKPWNTSRFKTGGRSGRFRLPAWNTATEAIDTEQKTEVKIQTETRIAIIYTSMMAATMYASRYVYGYSYDNPEIVRVLLPAQTAMLVYAIHAYMKNRKKTEGQQCRLHPGIIIYGILILAAAILHIGEGAYREYGDMIFLVLAANTLVGISEELVYRGTIARLAIARKGRVYAAVSSSVLFSLLHAVNLIGGLQPSAMLLQLANTFIYGILASTSMMIAGTIIPFIIFHSIWDMVMSSPVFVSRHLLLISIVMVSEVFIASLQLISIVKDERRNRKESLDIPSSQPGESSL